MDISDEGYLSLMNDTGELKDDVKLPDTDEGKSILARFKAEESFLVTVIVSTKH